MLSLKCDIPQHPYRPPYIPEDDDDDDETDTLCPRELCVGFDMFYHTPFFSLMELKHELLYRRADT
jgi:hypothetical protein